MGLAVDWVWARKKLTLWGVSYLPKAGRFYVCPLPGIGIVVKFGHRGDGGACRDCKAMCCAPGEWSRRR